ncbi:hypothetical protein JCGZ_08106 [Jatropha curcas]|uniref:Ribosome biogenesis protein BMS1/TSR1 C-terminal domain-containing protein n=1 Tax=Jatropha curcas TaxID=180498 RepID=A0A067KX26_JATCU|nr:hypothetical protein JCGZ_08106 [Jatropha curcas]
MHEGENLTREQIEYEIKKIKEAHAEDKALIKKHDSYDAPIKSKEELIVHFGFRKFVAR